MLNRRTLAAWIILVLVVGAAAVAWWLPRRGPATPSAPASPSVRVSRPASAGATPKPSVSSAPAGVPSAGVPRTPWTGTVEKVNDGDTLDVRTADGLHRVRLVGIDAPELAHGSPAQCGAQASKVALRTLAQGKEVTVVPDQVGDVSDRFGRRLAYVELPALIWDCPRWHLGTQRHGRRPRPQCPLASSPTRRPRPRLARRKWATGRRALPRDADQRIPVGRQRP